MEQEYSIKGLEKIINTAGKEKLAKYYGVDINADFESIITNDFKEKNIPSGLEVAFYFSIGPEEYNKLVEEKKRVPIEQDVALEIYEKDERKRAMFGFNYMLDRLKYDDSEKAKEGTYGNVLYFFVDEPINIEKVGSYMYQPRYQMGGVNYRGLLMGNAYYEKHKAELDNASPDKKNKEAVKNYIEEFMKEFKNVEFLGGCGPRGEYKETEEIKRQKNENEKRILELTGKNSIDELSLKDFILLKRNLEKEEERLQKEFEEKFTKKDSKERE